ncbi:MAG: class D sortase [Clostridiales bacterium]|nr:class D sortase [Clostridiales bacterium]
MQKHKLFIIPIVLFLMTMAFAWLLFFDYANALFSTAQMLQSASKSQSQSDFQSIEHPEEQIRTAKYPYYGDKIATVRIETAGIFTDVYQGDDDTLLSDGVGHSLASSMPGEAGTIILSAHRTTHFATLGDVMPGDAVEIDTYYGKYRYTVESTHIFDGNDTDFLSSFSGDTLILYTCYPFDYIGQAKQRYAGVCVPSEGAGVVWE